MLLRQKARKPALAPRALHVAVVAARYNSSLVDTLLRHALATLSQAGVRQIRVVRVPGSYEVPPVVMKLAGARRYHAVIALGVVLQGKTAHAEHITAACAVNLQRISIETGVPVIHQILTPRNLRDARARVRIRGVEAAQTALEMARVMVDLK